MLSSCDIKQKRPPFPYSFNNAIQAETLGCFEDNSSKTIALPLEPNNGTGIIPSEIDSDLSEGVSREELKNPSYCDHANNILPFNDPLMKCQWHLVNYGYYIQRFPSSSYFTEPGYVGADLKLLKKINDKTLLENFKGSGYKVHISDSGIEYNHEDISSNFNPLNSYDFCDKDRYPQPRPHKGETTLTSDHGTSVAGIISAISNNKKVVLA